jgi:hypothetical protein
MHIAVAWPRSKLLGPVLLALYAIGIVVAAFWKSSDVSSSFIILGVLVGSQALFLWGTGWKSLQTLGRIRRMAAAVGASAPLFLLLMGLSAAVDEWRGGTFDESPWVEIVVLVCWLVPAFLFYRLSRGVTPASIRRKTLIVLSVTAAIGFPIAAAIYQVTRNGPLLFAGLGAATAMFAAGLQIVWCVGVWIASYWLRSSAAEEAPATA